MNLNDLDEPTGINQSTFTFINIPTFEKQIAETLQNSPLKFQ